MQGNPGLYLRVGINSHRYNHTDNIFRWQDDLRDSLRLMQQQGGISDASAYGGVAVPRAIGAYLRGVDSVLYDTNRRVEVNIGDSLDTIHSQVFPIAAFGALVTANINQLQTTFMEMRHYIMADVSAEFISPSSNQRHGFNRPVLLRNGYAIGRRGATRGMFDRLNVSDASITFIQGTFYPSAEERNLGFIEADNIRRFVDDPLPDWFDKSAMTRQWTITGRDLDAGTFALLDVPMRSTLSYTINGHYCQLQMNQHLLKRQISDKLQHQMLYQQLAGHRGDCVFKYISDELNKQIMTHSDTVKLTTPQSVQNEFIDLGLLTMDKIGVTANDIIEWARWKRGVHVRVMSPLQLNVIGSVHARSQEAERTQAYHNGVRLQIMVQDGHCYPVDADTHERSQLFDEVKVKPRLLLTDKVSTITENEYEKWVNGDYDNVCVTSAKDLTPVCQLLFYNTQTIARQYGCDKNGHITSIVHPVTGRGLFSCEHYDAFKEICDKEGVQVEDSDEKAPIIAELLGDRLSFAAIGNALIHKLIGVLPPVKANGFMATWLDATRPSAIVQLAQSLHWHPSRVQNKDINTDGAAERSPQPLSHPTTNTNTGHSHTPPDNAIQFDIKSCFTNTLTNTTTGIPIITDFDTVEKVTVHNIDEIDDNSYYFMHGWNAFGFQWPRCFMIGNNVRELVATPTKTDLLSLIEYRIRPREFLPANTFRDAIQHIRTEYPDYAKDIINHFIGNSNTKSIKYSYVYLSSDLPTLQALLKDAFHDRNAVGGFIQTLSYGAPQSTTEAINDIHLHRLQVTYEAELEESHQYIYHHVMQQYLRDVYIIVANLFRDGHAVMSMKTDSFTVIPDGLRADGTTSVNSSHIIPENCHTERVHYPLIQITPPQQLPNINEVSWTHHDPAGVCFGSEEDGGFINGPAGCGKTTLLFEKLAISITSSLLDNVQVLVAAYQNMTVQSNKHKVMKIFDRHGIDYSVKGNELVVNGIKIVFRTVSWLIQAHKHSNPFRYIIIDEVSMLSKHHFSQLYDLKQSCKRHCIMCSFWFCGDFDQLLAVNENVYYYFPDTLPFKQLCDRRQFTMKLQAGKCRYQNQETIDAFNHYRQHGVLSKEALEKITVLPYDTNEARNKHVDQNNNIVLSNAHRLYLLSRLGKRNDQLAAGDSVLFICNHIRDQKYKRYGVYTNATYEIVSVNDNEVRIVNDDIKNGDYKMDATWKVDGVPVPLANVASNKVLTNHKMQGNKFSGAGTIHEWDKMSTRGRYTALTRFTKLSNITIISNDINSVSKGGEFVRQKNAVVKKHQLLHLCIYQADNGDYIMFDINNKPPQPRHLTKEQYQQRYNEETRPIYVLNPISSRSPSILLSHLSRPVIQDQVTGFAQLGADIDESYLQQQLNNIEDIRVNDDVGKLRWLPPFPIRREGELLKDGRAQLQKTYRYDSDGARGRAQVLAALQTEIHEMMNECLRTNATNVRVDHNRPITVNTIPQPLIVDESVYFSNQEDKYDPTAPSHNKRVHSTSFLTHTGHVHPTVGIARLTHNEYSRQAKPLHMEMVSGHLSSTRTFKRLIRSRIPKMPPIHTYFNTTTPRMAFHIINNWACQSFVEQNGILSDGFDHLLENTYQEICTVNTRMCFDIDLPFKYSQFSIPSHERPSFDNRDSDEFKAFEQRLERLIITNFVIRDLLTLIDDIMFEWKDKHLSLDSVRVCQSNRSQADSKFSWHVVIMNEIFPTIDHQHAFTLAVIDRACEEWAETHHNLCYEVDSDEPPSKRRRLNDGSDSNDQIKCIVDPIHSRNRAFRMPLCNKPGKDNMLFLMKLEFDGEEEIENINGLSPCNPDDWHIHSFDSMVNKRAIDSYLEYCVCVPLHLLHSYSVFSKARGTVSKKKKRSRSVRQTTLSKKEIKLIDSLIQKRDRSGELLWAGLEGKHAYAEKDVDGNVVSYIINRHGRGKCPSCINADGTPQTHDSRNVILFKLPINGHTEWFVQCFKIGSRKMLVGC